MPQLYPRFAALIALLLLASPASAAFTTINFDSLASNDSLLHDLGPTYSTMGFTLTATHFDPITNPPALYYVGTQSVIYPGATALYNHISLGGITLTRSDGGTFNFYSIDLAELPAGDAFGMPIRSPPFEIAFTGTFAGGSTLTETATVSSFLTLSTSTFSGFQNVESVTWFQGGGGQSDPTHQFDNIVVEATPEPASWVLAMAGLSILMGRQTLLQLKRRFSWRTGQLHQSATLSAAR